jgi:tyrosyl-tRNA synthetase
VLAEEVTRLVHSEDGLHGAKRITEALFSGSLDGLSEQDMMQLRLDGMPASTISRSRLPETLTQLLVEAGLAGSGKQVKDALGRKAVLVNNRETSWDDNGSVSEVFGADRAFWNRFYLVKLGKKKYHLFEMS